MSNLQVLSIPNQSISFSFRIIKRENSAVSAKAYFEMLHALFEM
jgi:hypothetical protein